MTLYFSNGTMVDVEPTRFVIEGSVMFLKDEKGSVFAVVPLANLAMATNDALTVKRID